MSEFRPPGVSERPWRSPRCLSATVLAAGGTAASDSHVAIEEETDEQGHGDVTRFTVSVPQGESVTLLVTELEYRQRLTLTDAIGDGEVRISTNIHLADRTASVGPVSAVNGRDRLSVENGSAGPLAVGPHRAAVFENGTSGFPVFLRYLPSVASRRPPTGRRFSTTSLERPCGRDRLGRRPRRGGSGRPRRDGPGRRSCPPEI